MQHLQEKNKPNARNKSGKGAQVRAAILKKYDANGNGELDPEESQKARSEHRGDGARGDGAKRGAKKGAKKGVFWRNRRLPANCWIF